MATLGGLSEEQSKLQKEREDALIKQFAGARARLGGVKREGMRQADQSFDRLKAQTGSAGGSIEKARQQGLQELTRGVGEVEAGLSAQEAQAQQALKQQEQALLQSEQQFGQTLEFQKDSFAQQMAFQWAELDESLKSNLINSMIALENSKLGTPEWRDELFQALFPGRAVDVGPAASESGAKVNPAQQVAQSGLY